MKAGAGGEKHSGRLDAGQPIWDVDDVGAV